MKSAWFLAGAIALVMAAACGDTESTGAERDETDGVRVASFDFTESRVIAEVYAQVLEERGIEVERLGAVGPREVVAPALEQGLIDVVPEYLGTAASYFGAGGTDPAAVAAVLSERGLVLLEMASAEDVNVFVVTTATASDHGLTAISDLSDLADGFRLGGPVECPERPFCLAGLTATYGLVFAEFVPLRTLAMTGEALERGEIEVGVMFSTAAALTSGPFVTLIDDRELQPPEFVVPVVRRVALDRWGPELADALNDVSAQLTTGALQGMNRRVQDGTPVVETASGWLRSVGLVAG